MSPTDRLWHWIHERYQIWQKRFNGKPKPWTDDPILQKYRFCNVYRELDKVTIWIAYHWRDCRDWEKTPDLWFAMAVARFVNWPDTLAQLKFPIPWDPTRFKTILRERKYQGKQVFTGAYIIPSGGPKINYVADKVLAPLWRKREDVRPVDGDTLQSFYDRLKIFNGFGSFMAGQVIADIKYARPLLGCEDWHNWAVPGPGSKRGLNRVLGQPKNQKWAKDEWKKALDYIHSEIKFKIQRARMPELHAQDLQNCLCEFDKYERVRLGEGKPRSRYPGQFADLLPPY